MSFNRYSTAPLVALLIACALSIDASAQTSKLKPGWITDPSNGCRVWNPNPKPKETITWSGVCPNDGQLTGKGVLQWYEDGKATDRQEGEYSDGKEHTSANMTPITVGEHRYDEKFVGCFAWDIAVKYGKWWNGTPSELEEIITNDEKQKRWLKENGCHLFTLTKIFIGEVLYKADQDQGTFVIDRNNEKHFSTNAVSILKVIFRKGTKDHTEIFMLAEAQVVGDPTQQTSLDLYFKSTIDFATLKKLIERP